MGMLRILQKLMLLVGRRQIGLRVSVSVGTISRYLWDFEEGAWPAAVVGDFKLERLQLYTETQSEPKVAVDFKKKGN
jgi:hypothetical protein